MLRQTDNRRSLPRRSMTFRLPPWATRLRPAPMQPIIRANRDTCERKLVQRRWGLVPFSTKSLADLRVRAQSMPGQKPSPVFYSTCNTRTLSLWPAAATYTAAVVVSATCLGIQKAVGYVLEPLADCVLIVHTQATVCAGIGAVSASREITNSGKLHGAGKPTR